MSVLIGVGSKSSCITFAISEQRFSWLGGSVEFLPSCAQGVGSKPILAAIPIVGRSFAFGDWLLFTLPVPLSIAVGVGSKPCDNPDPVPAVGCADGTSRNNKRLDGISRALKTFADFVEGEPLLLSVYVILLEQIVCASHLKVLTGLYHREEASNVFTNDPRGLYLPYRS